MSAVIQPWPEVMGADQAARYLEMHPDTLRDLLRHSKGPPGRKVGGRWKFHKPALDAYLAGTKSPQWPAPRTDLNPVASVESYGFASPLPVGARFSEVLKRRTGLTQPSGPAKSTRRRTGKTG